MIIRLSDYFGCRLAYMKSAWMADQGIRNTYFASIAKCLAGDVANKVRKAVSEGGLWAVQSVIHATK